MDKRPNIKKRIALELFRSIKKNRAKLHELRTLFWECTLRCNVSCRHCGSDCHVSASVPDMPVGLLILINHHQITGSFGYEEE